MQTLQITFHQMPHSAAVDEEVRRRADELARISDRIVSCHVLIEAPHKRRSQGIQHQVRIDLHVPGKHIVVGRAPDGQPDADDLFVVIHEAFEAARRQLEAHLDRQRPHAA